MPLRLGEGTAVLTGAVTVDDAEPLTAWLRRTTAPAVSMRNCTSLHTAALQALLAAGARVSSRPADPFLAAWVAPLLPGAADRPVTEGAGRPGPAEEDA